MASASASDARADTRGWLAGGAILLVIVAAAAALWIRYHG